MKHKKQNVVVNSGPTHHEFTVKNDGRFSVTNENPVDVRTFGRCLTDWIVREIGIIVDTFEDRIQNPYSTAIENSVTLRIKLAVRSANASSGGDVASVTASSERWEYTGITAHFENVSERDNFLLELNANYETPGNTPHKVGEMSVLLRVLGVRYQAYLLLFRFNWFC